MRLYETTFILSPDLEDADIEKNIRRYTKIIADGGGKIEKEERWGSRRMAYEINRKSQGYYVHLIHNSGPDTPRELERQFLLNENCLRYLTVVAPKLVPEDETKPKKATPFTDEGEDRAEAKPSVESDDRPKAAKTAAATPAEKASTADEFQETKPE